MEERYRQLFYIVWQFIKLKRVHTAKVIDYCSRAQTWLSHHQEEDIGLGLLCYGVVVTIFSSSNKLRSRRHKEYHFCLRKTNGNLRCKRKLGLKFTIILYVSGIILPDGYLSAYIASVRSIVNNFKFRRQSNFIFMSDMRSMDITARQPADTISVNNYITINK